jgi:hypothetical protein
MPERVNLDEYSLKVYNELGMQQRSFLTMGSEKTDEEATVENAPMRKLSVEFLKNYFEPHSVMSTLSCAGNCRDEFKSISKNV